MFIASATSPAQAYDRICTQAASSKQYLTAQAAAMSAASCDSQVPLAVILHLGQASGLMTTWAAVPGLATYAQAQVNDPTYDIVMQFNTMLTAMQSALSSLINMFPKDVNGFATYQTIQANGTLLNRTFTAAQLAPVVTLLNAVTATIA